MDTKENDDILKDLHLKANEEKKRLSNLEPKKQDPKTLYKLLIKIEMKIKEMF